MVLALASLLHVTSLATIVAHHVLVNAAPGDNVLFNATAVACISTVLHGNITLVRRGGCTRLVHLLLRGAATRASVWLSLELFHAQRSCLHVHRNLRGLSTVRAIVYPAEESERFSIVSSIQPRTGPCATSCLQTSREISRMRS